MNRAEAYRLLEIPETSSEEEAKKAYRRLAMKWHPDRNKEPGAEAKFKEIKEAFELIESGKPGTSSKAGPQPQYKTWTGNNSTAGSTNFEDLAEFLRSMQGKGFEAFKASRPKVDPIDDYKDQWGTSGPGASKYQNSGMNAAPVHVRLTLEEAFSGCTKTVHVPNEYSISGSLTPVQIPPGLSNGDLIRTFETSNHSIRVYAQIVTDYNVKFGPGIDSMEHPNIGAGNIEKPIEVSVITMVTGGFMSYRTIDGADVTVRIPAGLEAFRALRLKDKGYWKAARRRERGDCLLRIVPKIQRLDDLTDEQFAELKKSIEYAEELRKPRESAAN